MIPDSIFISWLPSVVERIHPGTKSGRRISFNIRLLRFTILSDCFRLPVRDRSYPTIVILWPRRWILLPIRPLQISRRGVIARGWYRIHLLRAWRSRRSNRDWLLPRIYGTFRARFYEEPAPETSRGSYNIEDGLLYQGDRVTCYSLLLSRFTISISSF